MPRISAFFTNNGTPIAAPATAPTIRIRRQDTGALVVTDLSMTEQGDGIFTYDFAEDPTLEYVFRCDGDPIVAGQVTIQERYVAGSFSGIAEQQQEQIEANAFGDAVTIDTVNGSAGTLFPLGTPGAPVNNLANALTIAAARGLRKFVLSGSITLGAGLTNWRIEGVAANNLVSIVNLGGFSVAGTEFKNVALTGSSVGFFTAQDCEFFGTLSGIEGIFQRCVFLGTITPAADSDIWLLDCRSGVAGVSTPVLNLTNMAAGGTVSLRAYSGGIDVQNCSAAAFTSTFEFVAGQIILAASLTAGTFVVRGIVTPTDNSVGATVIVATALDRAAVQALILNDATPFAGANIDAAITSRATQADILNDATPFPGANIDAAISSRAQAGDAMALTAGAVDDVWDELLAGHVAAGSAGEALTVLLDIIAGQTRIVSTAGDWNEEHLDWLTGLIVRRRYSLWGLDGGRITDANNPFTDAGLSRDAGFMDRRRTL